MCFLLVSLSENLNKIINIFYNFRYRLVYLEREVKMRLTQIRYFLEVCKCNNITQAAKNLYVSQPSVTVAIKDLEEELGVNLFNRIKQRIFLTEEGKFFYDESSKIIKKLDNLLEVVKDMGEKKNNVKIGIPPMIGSFLFPNIFLGFKESYPEINLEIYEYGTIESRELLLKEKLDLVITTGERFKPNEINFNTILKTSYGFYVGKESSLSRKERLSFKDISDEPLILFNKGFYINRIVMREFEKLGVKSPKIILETGQVETLKRFISKGIAAGFLTKNCVEDSDNLLEVPFETPMPITIGLEWKKDQYLRSDVANFIKYINKVYQL